MCVCVCECVSRLRARALRITSRTTQLRLVGVLPRSLWSIFRTKGTLLNRSGPVLLPLPHVIASAAATFAAAAAQFTAAMVGEY